MIRIVARALLALALLSTPLAAEQRVIGVGAVANNGQGDSPRVAFSKVNDNFAELYAAQAAVQAQIGVGFTARQPLSPTLTALAALTPAANRLFYATGPDTFAATDLSAYARGLMAAPSAIAAKSLLALNKADVGLSAADNTPDLSKPISTATQAALTSLQTALSDKLGAIDVTATATPGKIPRFYNVGGTGIAGLDVTGNGLIIAAKNVTGSDVHTLRIDRTADYTTGQFGFINSALQVNSTVLKSAPTFEAAALFYQKVYANAGTGLTDTPQNFNFAAQTRRYGTAPIWAGVLETIDLTGNPDPITGQLGAEVDVAANGTDASRNRQGIAIIIRRPGDAVGNHTGAPMAAGHGIILTRDVRDTAANRFRNGVSFGQAASPTDFELGLDFTYANFVSGGSAIQMVPGQRIAYDVGALHHTRYEANYWRYTTSGTEVARIHDSGSAAFGPVSPLVTAGVGAVTAGNPTNGGIVQVTDGVIDGRMQAKASTGMTVGTSSAHDLIFVRNGAEVARFTSNGRISIPSYTPPTSTSPCLAGEEASDAGYSYRCVSNNNWTRVARVAW